MSGSAWDIYRPPTEDEASSASATEDYGAIRREDEVRVGNVSHPYVRWNEASKVEGSPVWVRPDSDPTIPKASFVPTNCPECGAPRPKDRLCCGALLMTRRNAVDLLMGRLRSVDSPVRILAYPPDFEPIEGEPDEATARRLRTHNDHVRALNLLKELTGVEPLASA